MHEVLDDTARHDLEVLIPGDARWPDGLRGLGMRAPIALWVKGSTDLLSAPVTSRVTLTGSRAATGYGEQVAADLAEGAVQDGRQVVSGAAFGIDTAAHRATLAASGRPVAVLTGGLDRPYPAGNQELLAQIGQSGLLVSEAPPGVAPTRTRFTQRARMMAALSQSVVIVGAAYRSGALTTAEQAIRLGRAVGAVPGPVTSLASAGCHRLLREHGATPVTGYDDVRSLFDPAPDAPAARLGRIAQRDPPVSRASPPGHDPHLRGTL